MLHILIAFLAGFISTTASAAETTYQHGITMVDIPAGDFMMGSCTEEHNRQAEFFGLEQSICQVYELTFKNETPRHNVTVDSFKMSKTEVTLGQFRQFIAETGRTDLITPDFIQENAYGDDAPVTYVNWHDAQSFISWLNKTEDSGWRLPSEAEWEYACRAGGLHDKYCGGETYNDYKDISWNAANSGHSPWRDGGQRLHDVGTKSPNAFGLHDMTGNVEEWVQDCWHEDYTDAPRIADAWIDSCDSDERVLRGGSYVTRDLRSRAMIRGRSDPDTRNHAIGFRLVKTVYADD
tara:strand:- start:436 stop:1314 length:879 start_codon:yes stop_codon:yes gene_type:complete